MLIISGIYKITSPSNRIYIGQSFNINGRWKHYFKLDCKFQTLLFYSLKKYGSENHKFEIIHELPKDSTEEILNIYETFYWQQYKDCGFKTLNIRHPGTHRLPKETYEKRRGIPPVNKGKTMLEVFFKKYNKEEAERKYEEYKTACAKGQTGKVAHNKGVTGKYASNFKGKTIEEIHGIEKAREIRNKLIESHKGQVSHTSWNKGNISEKTLLKQAEKQNRKVLRKLQREEKRLKKLEEKNKPKIRKKLQPRSEEFKRKISDTKRKNPQVPWNKGKKGVYTEEQLNNMRQPKKKNR